jgi:hypothetical protein
MSTNTANDISSPTPLLIPIESTSEIPEWSILELNGELVLPQNPIVDLKYDAENSLVPAHHIELGSLKFDNEVGSNNLNHNVQNHLHSAQ